MTSKTSDSPGEQHAGNRSDDPRVDLRECKAEAHRLLAPGHPVRAILDAEPDFLQPIDAMSRLPWLLRIFWAHR